MPDIVLTTLNAKYIHASFGLRYLYANMGGLRPRTAIQEFVIGRQTVEVLDALLSAEPRVVGIGVYIWNIEPVTRLVAELKRVRPDVVVVLGGPEVSYEAEELEAARLADYVVSGEADHAFRGLCETVLDGRRPVEKFITAELPAMDALELPYEIYTNDDIANRVVYVEASRGCPFRCEFCLSALEIPVRQVPLDSFLAAINNLWNRGLRRFKFVDRTFNLNLRVSREILRFFLDRCEPNLFLHFEMIPDRLPPQLRELIRAFPAGSLQFEVGIQTFNDDVSARIERVQDVSQLESNLKFLRDETGVHVHADLIVGLPGEDVESFGAGFDRLVELGSQEIQVGMLKRLRGTPIVRHDEAFGMVYSPFSPYEILQTNDIDFATMSRMRRFARFWDLVGNSGNFRESALLMWDGGSPFESMLAFSDAMHETLGQAHGISLVRLAEQVFEFIVRRGRVPAEVVAETMWRDYQRGGRSDVPRFLREFELSPATHSRGESRLPARQARHVVPAQ